MITVITFIKIAQIFAFDHFFKLFFQFVTFLCQFKQSSAKKTTFLTNLFI